MKTDLATAIGAAIVGLIIAFLITGFFTGPIEDVTYKTIDSKVSTELADPDSEVFNYRALNPTVEVYIGSCVEYSANGECLETLEAENETNTEGEANPEDELDQENF